MAKISSNQKNPNSYNTSVFPTWCPGCGDFGIWGALKQALELLEINPDQVAFFFGVGCSGNISSFIRGYGFHSLHGRAIANAIGAKLANHKMPVIVIAGDGDLLGEGISHFIHSARANHDITVILHNNGVFGLTTGQASPTAVTGFKSKPIPTEITDEPVNPCALAIMHQAGFVSRGFAGDQEVLCNLISQAIAHPGFSLVDVLQPCVTFNPDKSYIWYRQRINPVKIPAKDVLTGIKNSLWTDKRIATGIIYQNSRDAFHTNYPQLQTETLLATTGKKRNIQKLLKGFK
ncbi:2-oxoacid ferredoxin oxidoreductase [Candidatus Collierbacteria bacterium]|nr:2-oxoacid ferredoxin oxidoreductase [Candidatus Collierbacteria bacterium]